MKSLTILLLLISVLSINALDFYTYDGTEASCTDVSDYIYKIDDVSTITVEFRLTSNPSSVGNLVSISHKKYGIEHEGLMIGVYPYWNADTSSYFPTIFAQIFRTNNPNGHVISPDYNQRSGSVEWAAVVAEPLAINQWYELQVSSYGGNPVFVVNGVDKTDKIKWSMQRNPWVWINNLHTSWIPHLYTTGANRLCVGGIDADDYPNIFYFSGDIAKIAIHNREPVLSSGNFNWAENSILGVSPVYTIEEDVLLYDYSEQSGTSVGESYQSDATISLPVSGSGWGSE